jgi:ABC-2 type transport system permease protein
LPVTIAYVLARIVGPYVAVGAGIVWQIAGTVQAESSHWLMMPWTWAVRPLLPLYEIHASGVPLEPGSPIVSCPVIPGVLTSLVGALVVAAVAIATAGVEARLPGNTRGSRLIAPIGALALGLRRTPLLWLTGCAVLLLIAVGFVYRPGAAGVVAAAAIVPIGCTLTAVTAWAVTAPAWRILALRRSVAQLCLRLGGSIVLLLGVVVAAGAAVDVLRGSVDLRALLVMSVSGVALLLVSLWLTTRWGPGMALSVGMAGWILSVTVTGSELATAAIPVWFLGYATWALAATTWPRAAVMCVMAAVLGAVAFSGWLRAARRSAATG